MKTRISSEQYEAFKAYIADKKNVMQLEFDMDKQFYTHWNHIPEKEM